MNGNTPSCFCYHFCFTSEDTKALITALPRSEALGAMHSATGAQPKFRKPGPSQVLLPPGPAGATKFYGISETQGECWAVLFPLDRGAGVTGAWDRGSLDLALGRQGRKRKGWGEEAAEGLSFTWPLQQLWEDRIHFLKVE